MKRALLFVALLSLLGAARAEEATPEGILILDGPNSKMLGKVQMVTSEENGQQVQKPDPWVPGNVLIIRQADEATAKGLKVKDGAAEIGGAYRIRENRELEFVRKVDLSKTNQALAKEFGMKPEKKPKGAR